MMLLKHSTVGKMFVSEIWSCTRYKCLLRNGFQMHFSPLELEILTSIIVYLIRKIGALKCTVCTQLDFLLFSWIVFVQTVVKITLQIYTLITQKLIRIKRSGWLPTKEETWDVCTIVRLYLPTKSRNTPKNIEQDFWKLNLDNEL